MGKHRGQIAGKDFVRVQRLLEANSRKGDAYHKARNEIALLSGILYCTCGRAMRPKYYHSKQVTKEGERKFSYICPYKDKTHGEKCNVANVPGNSLDIAVCRELFQYAQPDSQVGQMLQELKKEIGNKKESLADEQKLLKQSIMEKEKTISNLIEVIAQSGRSPEFIVHIDEEISRLSKECDELKEKLERQVKEKKVSDTQIDQTEWVISELRTFEKAFHTLSVPRKREYLKILLEKVVWDGEKAHIVLVGSR